MGLDIKIISDDQMGKMLGSDLQDLSNCGIPVRYDSDPHAHMHHKFCLIDDHIIINGSFNWTV
jgi:cardiolipin hydrolase